MNPDATQPLVDQDTLGWLPERLDRAKRSAIQDLLAELGYADVEALKQTLQTQAQQVTDLTASQTELQTTLASTQTAHRQAVLESAFRQEAARYRFYDPQEARALLQWEAIHVDDSDQVTGMAEALLQLVKTRPHLVKRSRTPHIDSTLLGQGAGQAELSPEQVDDLKRRFKLW